MDLKALVNLNFQNRLFCFGTVLEKTPFQRQSPALALYEELLGSFFWSQRQPPFPRTGLAGTAAGACVPGPVKRLGKSAPFCPRSRSAARSPSLPPAAPRPGATAIRQGRAGGGIAGAGRSGAAVWGGGERQGRAGNAAAGVAAATSCRRPAAGPGRSAAGLPCLPPARPAGARRGGVRTGRVVFLFTLCRGKAGGGWAGASARPRPCSLAGGGAARRGGAGS